jgi:glycosyltransferase involved in cell wall biosynthesis
MKLTILICSLVKRAHFLKRLTDILDKQVDGINSQYLVNVDAGQLKIADKRNKLLELATGEYICFIDDDDLVPDYYVAEILNAIQTKSDVIGFNGYMTTNGTKKELFSISNRYEKWDKIDGRYVRTINHLCPVKRELALQVKFPKGMQCGEDAEYANKLKPLIKTEVFIEKDMYHYDYNSTTSTQGK